ncbi:putative Ig domain-containing protein [Bacteroidota bacterium]
MKKTINAIIFLILCTSLSATKYYVSPSGDNNNSGTSEDLPFQIVQFAIDQMTAGDTLIILDGLYTGTLQLKSGITIKAKNPRKAIFSGAEALNATFTKHSEKIYKTRLEKEIKQLFFDDRPLQWAQWPNISWSENWVTSKKWKYAGDGSDQGVFTCNDFAEIQNLDLVGAYCFMRYGKGNSCYSRLIESFDGAFLHWNTDQFFSKVWAGEDGYKGSAPNSEFFIAGALDLLDAPGEWVVKDSVLYIYPPEGKDPNDEVLLIKTNDYSIYQSTAISDINIDGIDFFSTSVYVGASNNSNVSITNAYFTYIGTELLWINKLVAKDRPIYIRGSNIEVKDCLFAGAQNSALEISGEEVTVENCVFLENNRNANFGSRPLVLNPSGYYKVSRNTFFNNCSDAIRVSSPNNYDDPIPPEMSYNHICNAGLYNTDVSGIYAPILSQKFAEVHHNWIHNVKGNGYRLDQAGYELSLHHNVFWQSKRGINVEGFQDFNIYNNTSFHHETAEKFVRNVTDRQGYEYPSWDTTFAPIEDWNVLNNLIEQAVDGEAPSEKTILAASRASGILHPEREASSSFPLTNRGSMQGNIFGDIDYLFKNPALSGLNLLPKDFSVRGGVLSHDSLVSQMVSSLDSYRGAYNYNDEYWYPGSTWMPYDLEVITSMADAEAFAKAYHSVSLIPEIEIPNLLVGYLNRGDDGKLLSSITWPDYEMSGDFDDWTDIKQDTLPDFSPNKLNYSIILPDHYTNIPALTATTLSPQADLEIERATTLRGTIEDRTTTFTVTDRNDGSVRIYSVVFKFADVEYENTEPFISELINGRYNHDDYVEIYNPKNNPISLNLSKYLLVNVPVNTAEDDILNGFYGMDPDSSGIHYCYVPGYKYAYNKNGSENPADWTWKNGIQGAITPDENVLAIVAPGDVFLISSYGTSGSAELEVVLQGGLTSDVVDINLCLNPDFPNSLQGLNVANYVLNRALFLCKILNDSILDGTKGLWEDSHDYELVDRVEYDPAQGDIISGFQLLNGARLIRKPYVQVGSLLANSSLHPDVSTSDWIHHSRNRNIPAEWKISGKFLGDSLGKHTMQVSNEGFISAVTSNVFQVDVGLLDELNITGDITGITVNEFIDNLVKQEALQTISVYGTEGLLPDDGIIESNDTVLVVSANGRYSTRYILKNRLLSSNTFLSEVPGSTVVVDNENFTLSGFDYTASVSEVLAGITCDSLSYINILDGNDDLVPLLTRTLDTSIVEPIATKVMNEYKFQVVAEDGSVSQYTLIPNSSVSEAYILSNLFSIDQDAKSISGVDFGISLDNFMAYVYPSGNASIVVQDNENNERNNGLLQADDCAMVTSEDETFSAKYSINFQGDSNMVQRISIRKSLKLISLPVKTAKVDSEYQYVINTSGTGDLTASISPQVAWLSFSEGVLSGTPAESNLGTDVDVTLRFENEEDSVVQQFTINIIPDIPIAITSDPIDYAIVGEEYRYIITTNGTGALLFDDNVSDAMVEWLSLIGDTLVGTPGIDDLGSHSIIINFENELENASQEFTLRVLETMPLSITSAPDTIANAGEKYNYTISTSGEGSLSFSTTPDVEWLTLDSTLLSGTPAIADTGTVEVSIIFANESDTVRQDFTIVVYAASLVSEDRLKDIKVFPNPAFENVHISNLSVGATLKLFNNTGRLVASYATNDDNMIIPISDLMPGLYLIRIDIGTSQKAIKLVVDPNY